MLESRLKTIRKSKLFEMGDSNDEFMEMSRPQTVYSSNHLSFCGPHAANYNNTSINRRRKTLSESESMDSVGKIMEKAGTFSSNQQSNFCKASMVSSGYKSYKDHSLRTSIYKVSSLQTSSVNFNRSMDKNNSDSIISCNSLNSSMDDFSRKSDKSVVKLSEHINSTNNDTTFDKINSNHGLSRSHTYLNVNNQIHSHNISDPMKYPYSSLYNTPLQSNQSLSSIITPSSNLNLSSKSTFIEEEKIKHYQRTDLVSEKDLDKLFNSNLYISQCIDSTKQTDDLCIPLLDISIETGEIVFLEALNELLKKGDFKVDMDNINNINNKSYKNKHGFNDILRLSAPKIITIIPTCEDSYNEMIELYGDLPGKKSQIVDKINSKTKEKSKFNRIFLTRCNNLNGLNKNIRGKPAIFDQQIEQKYDDLIYLINFPILNDNMKNAFTLITLISSSIIPLIPSNVDHPCKIPQIENCLEHFATIWDPKCKVEDITKHMANSIWVKPIENNIFNKFNNNYENENLDNYELPWGSDVLSKVFSNQYAIDLGYENNIKKDNNNNNNNSELINSKKSSISEKLLELYNNRISKNNMDDIFNGIETENINNNEDKDDEDNEGNKENITNNNNSSDPDFKPEESKDDWNTLFSIYGYSNNKDNNSSNRSIVDSSIIPSPNKKSPPNSLYQTDLSIHSLLPEDLLKFNNEYTKGILDNKQDKEINNEEEFKLDIGDELCISFKFLMHRILNCKWPAIKYPVPKKEEDFAITTLLMNTEDIEFNAHIDAGERRSLSLIEWTIYVKVIVDILNKQKKLSFLLLSQMMNYRTKYYLNKRILSEYDNFMKSVLPKQNITTGKYIPFSPKIISQRNEQTILLLKEIFGERYKNIIEKCVGQVDLFGNVVPANGHAKFYIDFNKNIAIENIESILRINILNIKTRINNKLYGSIEEFEKDYDNIILALSSQGCYPELLTDSKVQDLFKNCNQQIEILRNDFNLNCDNNTSSNNNSNSKIPFIGFLSSFKDKESKRNSIRTFNSEEMIENISKLDNNNNDDDDKNKQKQEQEQVKPQKSVKRKPLLSKLFRPVLSSVNK